MADTASLIVRVSSTGVDKTTSQLNGLTKAAGAAAAAVVSLETAKQVFSALVDSQRNFDKLNSGLITMTGSAENAAKAFSVLQQFAKETPYGLNQAVEGFTKLVALGLNPSKEALISYGNTAAAMGKDLNQMIEAVADASTFEFERLKEFGIKSSQQADTVSFTFRGVTTTVKKNSEEIQKYLLNIGNTDFAGAMETRSKTLDGQLSSLADSFDGLVLAVAQSGFGDAVGEQAATAEDAITALTDAIASNEIAATLQDWVALFNESFKFISDALNDLAFDTEDKSVDMSDSLGTIPDAIREWLPDIQQTFHEVIAWFQRIDDYAVALGQTLADVFDPSKTAALTFKNLTAEADAAYAASIKRAEAESQAITNRSKQRKKEIEEQRKQYDERKKQEIDLASLVNKKGGTGGAGNTDDKAAKAAAKKAEQLRNQAQDYLDTLARQNNDELKAIDAQEQQKLAKAKEFYSQGALSLKEYEQAKTAIVLEAGQKRQDELDKRQKEAQEKQQKGDDFMAQIMGQNATELELLDIQEQQKLAVADKYREQGLISETQYQAALNAINEQYATKRADATATAFGNMASNIGSALGEASGAYKAFAIVQATIATYTAAIEAYKSTAAIPVVGPFLAPVAAAAAVGAGMAQVSAIRSAREQGGQLSAGQASTIAERGKPEVIMPAGASRVRTAQQMKEIMGQNGSSSGPSNVTIVNNTSSQIGNVSTEQDDEGRLRIIIEEQVAASLQNSNSKISKARKATRNAPGFK
ncbi:tail length tape measure protein [Escherichia phage K1ind2]|uniref:Putative tape measure protein n=2 Tax=Kagunavirus K1ind2 TaxID=1911009 RepID=D2XJU1_9CAUD|nr:tail length tape measure protein [Escherichia phage K1ind2]ADA82420.1 putative tape measure protein [Escherichia phage K1ind2]ADA82469.1 putative tape measure protein [Escherichia phage K1ind3]